MQEILTKLGLEDIPPVEVPERLSQALKEFNLSNKRFLVLYGPTGTFKTTAVKKFLKALAEEKYAENKKVGCYDIKFVDFVDMPKLWQEEEEVFYKTKLLAIDDLVFSGFSDNFWVKLFALINYRYTKDLKTIITTNHNLTQFLQGEVNSTKELLPDCATKTSACWFCQRQTTETHAKLPPPHGKSFIASSNSLSTSRSAASIFLTSSSKTSDPPSGNPTLFTFPKHFHLTYPSSYSHT